MGAVGGCFGILFGIFWTIGVYSSIHSSPFANSPTPLIDAIFPLFGVVFVIIGIINVIYNLSNATSPNRFSSWDIASSDEESDPFNEVFGPHSASMMPFESIASIDQ